MRSTEVLPVGRRSNEEVAHVDTIGSLLSIFCVTLNNMKPTAPLLLTTLALFAAGVSATVPFQSHRVAFVARGGSDEPKELPKEAVEEVVKEDVEKDDENSPNEEETPECVGDACEIRGGAKEGGNGSEEEYEEYDEAEEADEEEVFEDAFEELEELEGTESYVEEEPVDDVAVDAEEADEEIPADASEEGEFGFQTEVIQQHATDDGDSSAFVDREELADAYDDDETAMGATAFRAGHTDDDDRVSIDDVPDAAEPIQEYEQAEPEAVVDDEGEETEEAPEKSSEAAVESSGISKEVEKILIDECGFSKAELRGMKPDIANVMAEKRLRRPVEGIPPTWYEEKTKGNARAIIGKVLTTALPLALGALAVYGGTDVRKLLFFMKSDDDLLIGEEKEKAAEKPRKDKSELTIVEAPAPPPVPVPSVKAVEPQEAKGFLEKLPGFGAVSGAVSEILDRVKSLLPF